MQLEQFNDKFVLTLHARSSSHYAKLLFRCNPIGEVWSLVLLQNLPAQLIILYVFIYLIIIYFKPLLVKIRIYNYLTSLLLLVIKMVYKDFDLVSQEGCPL